MGRILAFAVIGLVFFASVAAPFTSFFGIGFWLAIPIGLAVAFVFARRMAPFKAALFGTIVTFGVIVGLAFPAIVINALQGDFDNRDYCDGFCFSNGGGFLFATFILLFVAVPTSLASGVISFFAALVTPRISRSA